jgi:hypothetical protein
MKVYKQDVPIVALSIGLYVILLQVYPTKFRQEYGSHMMQAFRDSCLRAVKNNKPGGLMKLWLVTLIDFVQSVISEHIQKETEMKKSKILKFIGIALMIAGFVLFSATFGSQSFWKFIGSIGLTGDIMHPVLAWLGLGVMAVGLTMLYLQLSPSQRSKSKWAFGFTGFCILVLIVFMFGFINPIMMSLGNPAILFSVYSLMLLSSLLVIVISLDKAETSSQIESKA